MRASQSRVSLDRKGARLMMPDMSAWGSEFLTRESKASLLRKGASPASSDRLSTWALLVRESRYSLSKKGASPMMADRSSFSSSWLSRLSSTSRSTSAGGRIGANSWISSMVTGSSQSSADSSFWMMRFKVLEVLSEPRSSSMLI